jgi:hypothetical protein
MRFDQVTQRSFNNALTFHITLSKFVPKPKFQPPLNLEVSQTERNGRIETANQNRMLGKNAALLKLSRIPSTLLPLRRREDIRSTDASIHLHPSINRYRLGRIK